MPPDPLLDVHPDASSALGLGRTKTWELVYSGQLRTIRIGRRRLVPASALEELVGNLGNTEAQATTARASVSSQPQSRSKGENR